MATIPAQIDSISTAYKTLFQKTFNDTTSVAEDIATRIDSSDLNESYVWLGSFPDMKEWLTDRVVEEFTAHDYTIKNKSYEATVTVPVKALEYDKAGVYRPAIAQMAENCKKFGGKLLMQMVKNGHTNDCYDGKKFFATDHTIGADTYSNLGNIALTESNLLATYAFMMSIKNANGDPLGVLPTTLVIGPQHLATAKDLIDLDKSGTNKAFKLVKYIIEPSITGLEWYLLDTGKQIRPFILQVVQDGDFTSDDSQKFMKNAVLYGAESFMNAGYGLWQLAYKSDGGN